MTEACVLTKNDHPVSIFSQIHSSREKDFTSINDFTFSAMERGAALFGKATFVMDRGYDDNSSGTSAKERSKHPLSTKAKAMMLATNKEIHSREDVIKVAKTCFPRWRIEEYFRCKKQVFQFENFRVRKLTAINALNFYITLCMAFLAHISMKPETNALKISVLQKADPVKEKVHFCYYRLAKSISGILSYAKEGIRLWFRTKRTAFRQLCFKLVV